MSIKANFHWQPAMRTTTATPKLVSCCQLVVVVVVVLVVEYLFLLLLYSKLLACPFPPNISLLLWTHYPFTALLSSRHRSCSALLHLFDSLTAISIGLCHLCSGFCIEFANLIFLSRPPWRPKRRQQARRRWWRRCRRTTSVWVELRVGAEESHGLEQQTQTAQFWRRVSSQNKRPNRNKLVQSKFVVGKASHHLSRLAGSGWNSQTDCVACESTSQISGSADMRTIDFDFECNQECNSWEYSPAHRASRCLLPTTLCRRPPLSVLW